MSRLCLDSGHKPDVTWCALPDDGMVAADVSPLIILPGGV
jgi:hypothetical protein